MSPTKEQIKNGVSNTNVSTRSSRVEPSRVQRELTSLASVLGRKWNLVLIDRLLTNGPMGFSDLLNSVDSISSKVLSESLDELESAGFVNREIVSERPFRVEYTVTSRGTAIEPIITDVRDGSLRVT